MGDNSAGCWKVERQKVRSSLWCQLAVEKYIIPVLCTVEGIQRQWKKFPFNCLESLTVAVESPWNSEIMDVTHSRTWLVSFFPMAADGRLFFLMYSCRLWEILVLPDPFLVLFFFFFQDSAVTEVRIKTLANTLQMLVYEYVCRSIFKVRPLPNLSTHTWMHACMHTLLLDSALLHLNSLGS